MRQLGRASAWLSCLDHKEKPRRVGGAVEDLQWEGVSLLPILQPATPMSLVSAGSLIFANYW